MMVRIETPAGIVAGTGRGTKVTTLDGHEVNGISGIDICIRPNCITKARLEVHGSFVGIAKADFCVVDPKDRTLKPVKRIEFADGTFWSPESPSSEPAS